MWLLESVLHQQTHSPGSVWASPLQSVLQRFLGWCTPPSLLRESDAHFKTPPLLLLFLFTYLNEPQPPSSLGAPHLA